MSQPISDQNQSPIVPMYSAGSRPVDRSYINGRADLSSHRPERRQPTYLSARPFDSGDHQVTSITICSQGVMLSGNLNCQVFAVFLHCGKGKTNTPRQGR